MAGDTTAAGRSVLLLAKVTALVAVAAFGIFAQEKTSSPPTTDASQRMADGKQWTTRNLSVTTPESYCFDNSEQHCARYGRLYTWDAARRACQSLGAGWRLPTDDDWREMTKHYGGVGSDSEDNGKAAFAALLSGGAAGFDAVLGGNRAPDGQYSRLEAHGLYWTASENNESTAPFYNFGKGSQALFRQPQGNKGMAISVRCISN